MFVNQLEVFLQTLFFSACCLACSEGIWYLLAASPKDGQYDILFPIVDKENKINLCLFLFDWRREHCFL